jgi:thioredoxin 1
MTGETGRAAAIQHKENSMSDTATLQVTDDTFASEIEQSSGLSLVDFWAAWCGPCRMVGPIVDQLAAEYADRGVTVAKLDVDSNPRTTARFGVRSIPAILFFKDGKQVDSVVGAVPKAVLEQRIQHHL